MAFSLVAGSGLLKSNILPFQHHTKKSWKPPTNLQVKNMFRCNKQTTKEAHLRTPALSLSFSRALSRLRLVASLRREADHVRLHRPHRRARGADRRSGCGAGRNWRGAPPSPEKKRKAKKTTPSAMRKERKKTPVGPAPPRFFVVFVVAFSNRGIQGLAASFFLFCRGSRGLSTPKVSVDSPKAVFGLGPRPRHHKPKPCPDSCGLSWGIGSEPYDCKVLCLGDTGFQGISNDSNYSGWLNQACMVPICP